MLTTIKFRTRHIQGLAQRYFKTIVRKPSPTDFDLNASACRPRPPCPLPRLKPPFDMCEVQVEETRAQHEPCIRSFLHNEYFPREPSLQGLNIAHKPTSFYLQYLANHYVRESNGFIAFRIDHQRKEKEIVGLVFGKKKFPWEAELYEKWAQRSKEPECIHMFFHAHCFRSPDIFKKYNVPFVYDIEVISTAEEHAGKGVAEFLLRRAILHTIEMCYPVVQMIVTNSFMINPCKRLGMRKEWTMHYREYVDHCGSPLFCLRRPHTTVNLFIRTLPCYNELSKPEFCQFYKNQKRPVNYPIKYIKPVFACSQPPPQKKC
ncbi:hypothetical protein O0L34_g18423 [Tuta absoluta]|nr:hypothetical protein O0L34_g18423 [Tuta absoluta]